MIRTYVKKLIPITCIVIFVAFAAVVGQASAKQFASNKYANMTDQTDTEIEVQKEVTTETPAQVVAEPPVEPEVIVEQPQEPVPEVVEPEPEPEPIVETPQPDPTIRICIDPGHGGSSLGTRWEYDGVMIEEKNLNYRIATSLKGYLEQYSNVQVMLTRDANGNPGLADRINYAAANNADYFVSVHINSKSRDDLDAHGCMVLMSCSRYQPGNTKVASLYDTELAMAQNIIANLNGLGIPLANDWEADQHGGLLQRVGDGTYPDGSPADYYGIIYNGTSAGIPSIIVEHAFLSSENDYRDYLCSDDKLDALARADANGIASALGLQ